VNRACDCAAEEYGYLGEITTMNGAPGGKSRKSPEWSGFCMDCSRKARRDWARRGDDFNGSRQRQRSSSYQCG